jgi:hypothetical protein
MTYTGHVKNGVIVLDEPTELPEGAKVTIDFASDPVMPEGYVSPLLKYAGMAQGLPSDASVNVDHYLYGHPKREADIR